MTRTLLYRSKPVRAGRSGAAIDLTPRALGWSRIHFAVRQLAAGGEWRAYAPREERCLVLCEVFTPGGNWSSYPPHKHDVDDPPREADLDEIYYYRYREPDAYGFQRLYTDRRDETLRVSHGDVVAVRDGYHPFVTAYGYDAYYLNVLAGSRRSMAASDDPRYAQLRREWPPPDPRLPLVRR